MDPSLYFDSVQNKRKLDAVIDSNSDTPTDLGKIADTMDEWEGKVAEALRLTQVDVKTIRVEHKGRHDLQTRAALRKWKEKHGCVATYRSLILAFLNADKGNYAEAVCRVLQKEGTVTTPKSESPEQYSEIIRSQARNYEEGLEESEKVCKSLLDKKACTQCAALRTQVKQFSKFVSDHKHFFLKTRIQSNESQLNDFLKTNSPFNPQHLTTWLEYKEKEIKVLETYLTRMESESVKLVSKIDLQGEITDANLKNSQVVCFSFNVTSTEDDFLKQMHAALYQLVAVNTVTPTSWIENEDKRKKLNNKVTCFLSFVEANAEAKHLRFVMTECAECADETQPKDEPVILLYAGENLVRGRKFNPPSEPRSVKVVSEGITDCSICLDWSKPEWGSESVDYYTICYKKSEGPEKSWKTMKADRNETLVRIDGLEADTKYVFKLRAECEVGVGKYSNCTNPVETKPGLGSSLPVFLINDWECKKRQDKTVPAIYSLPTSITHKVPGKMYCKVAIGKASSQVQDIVSVGEKVLMVVGATGAGKTTLINGMINYILGVTWKDDFRFELISEEKKANQAQSQTQVVTAYTIPRITHSLFQCTLTIIDTPGFGDTRGIDQDNEITRSIKELFRDPKGIAHLDGVGFVTQSSLPRLTPTQKYIFDSVLKIFGKDVADNIFVLTTFSDTKDPPVISALIEDGFLKEDGFHNSKLFKFNNSALYARKEGNIDETFWKMGKRNFSEFFLKFKQTKSVSVRLTLDVLKERNELSSSLEKLQGQVDTYLDFMVSKDKQSKGSTAEDQTDLNSFHELIDKVAEHMNKLVEIAVRPHPITPVEYIQLLISNEMDWRKQKRLELAKKRAEILSRIRKLSDTDSKIKSIDHNDKDSVSKLQNERQTIMNEVITEMTITS